MAKKHISRKKASSRKSIPTWVWAALAAGVVIVFVVVLLLTNRPATEKGPTETAVGTTPADISMNKPATEKVQIETAVGTMPADISISDAYEKYQAGAFLLDVRTPAEWESVRIPNTTLIPLDELTARVSEVPEDQEIVVVCRSGNRSKVGRDILRQAGYKQVSSMSGGVNAWKAAGYPTEP